MVFLVEIAFFLSFAIFSAALTFVAWIISIALELARGASPPSSSDSEEGVMGCSPLPFLFVVPNNCSSTSVSTSVTSSFTSVGSGGGGGVSLTGLDTGEGCLTVVR